MQDQIKSFVETDLLAGRSVALDDPLLLGGLVDSLGVMRLVAFLERTFSFKVPAGDLKIANFGTIEAIAAYVKRMTT